MKMFSIGLIVLLSCLPAISDTQTVCIDMRGVRGDYTFNHSHGSLQGEWSVGGSDEVYHKSMQGISSFLLPERIEPSAVFALDSDVWVGGKGIYHSMDKGQSWIKEPVETNSSVESITCVDSNTCWAVTIGGDILKYDAKNGRWATIPNQTKNALYAVEFLNKAIGWASGEKGIVLITSNGGKTWTKQFVQMRLFPDSDFDRSIFGLKYLRVETKDVGWVGGVSGVAFTEDGGKTWRKSELPGTTLGIVRLENGKLVAVSKYCKNLESDDDGKTWKSFER